MTVKKDHSIGEGTGAVAGAIAGAAVGSAAGPVGTVVGAVADVLADARRVIFDRGWNEKRVFGVIAQNPLDYTGSEEVMAWAEAHSRMHVSSFAAK